MNKAAYTLIAFLSAASATHGSSTVLYDQDATVRFLLAAIDGDVQSMQESINAHAYLMARDNKCSATALHHIVRGNHIPCLEILLKTKAVDLDAFDGYGKTPVHVAAYLGHTQILELLHSAGALLDKANRDGMTPLHMAVLRGQIESVRTLARLGASINARTQSDATALHFAAVGGEKGFRDAEPSFHPLIPMERPFSEAANKEITKILLAYGADYTARQNSDITPEYLAHHYNNKGVIEIFERTCARCQKKAALYQCSQCKQKAYCNATCQRIHWATHKDGCIKDPSKK